VSIQSVGQICFEFFGKSPQIVVEATDELASSDAGLLAFRQFDERLGWTREFAAALGDPRKQECIEHELAEMVHSRVYGILAGYPDQNDHDTLRGDPIFKLIAGRLPLDDDLASQPTLSRFENAIDIPSLWRLQDLFIDQFIASFDEPPAEITLDIDPFDDPTHGQQQLTFFHGYYGQYQYLPRVITCAENDLVVMVCLLFGTAAPYLGAEDDLRHLVRRLREAWPDVIIHIRGDSALGVPLLYDTCETLNIFYSFGQKMNSRLQERSENRLQEAISEHERTGQPQRLFEALEYQAGSWPHARWTIVKCEAHAQGTNRRAVTTNRPGARVTPMAAYDEYADRGESENRNKELKCELSADRLSDHRFLANFFRLYLHGLAHNLLARLRRHVALPPEETEGDVPADALAGSARRSYFNRRRERDPLGEGHACTWRTRLIKVAARVTQSTRRVLVQLSQHWPHLPHFTAVSAAVLGHSLPALEPG
jgi:hypothetical protein